MKQVFIVTYSINAIPNSALLMAESSRQLSTTAEALIQEQINTNEDVTILNISALESLATQAKEDIAVVDMGKLADNMIESIKDNTNLEQAATGGTEAHELFEDYGWSFQLVDSLEATAGLESKISTAITTKIANI